MNKNTLTGIIIVLIILCIGEAYFIYRERSEKIAVSTAAASRQTNRSMANQPPRSGQRPSLLMKGQKFADNPISKKAYLIFPTEGDITGDAKTAMTGWDMKTTSSTDGSTQVDLIPKEAEDIKQSFTVKPGYKLYFIEMTLSDDKTGVDENRGDDMGVLVDQNGIVE